MKCLPPDEGVISHPHKHIQAYIPLCLHPSGDTQHSYEQGQVNFHTQQCTCCTVWASLSAAIAKGIDAPLEACYVLARLLV